MTSLPTAFSDDEQSLLSYVAEASIAKYFVLEKLGNPCEGFVIRSQRKKEAGEPRVFVYGNESSVLWFLQKLYAEETKYAEEYNGNFDDECWPRPYFCIFALRDVDTQSPNSYATSLANGGIWHLMLSLQCFEPSDMNQTFVLMQNSEMKTNFWESIETEAWKIRE